LVAAWSAFDHQNKVFGIMALGKAWIWPQSVDCEKEIAVMRMASATEVLYSMSINRQKEPEDKRGRGR
jgi:hypothetical protein